MKLRKIVTLATASAVATTIALFGSGITAAYAVDEPITFQVDASGSLAIAQTPTAGTALNNGTSAVNMPVTTITDSRNGTTRAWTVTGSSTALALTGHPSIPSTDITLGVLAGGDFTTGSGTVGALGLVSVTGDSIDSVYSYTPTALLAAQGNIPAGSYAGTVTQTVL